MTPPPFCAFIESLKCHLMQQSPDADDVFYRKPAYIVDELRGQDWNLLRWIYPARVIQSDAIPIVNLETADI